MLRQIEDEYLYPVAYAQTSFNEFVILTQAPLPSLVIDRTSIPPVGKPAVRWFGGGTPGSFCLFHGKPQCHLTSTSALWTWLGTTRIRNSTQVKIYHLLKCIFSFDFFFFSCCVIATDFLHGLSIHAIFLNSQHASLRETCKDGSETDLFLRLVPVINE